MISVREQELQFLSIGEHFQFLMLKRVLMELFPITRQRLKLLNYRGAIAPLNYALVKVSQVLAGVTST